MKNLQKIGEILILISQIGIVLATLTYMVSDIRSTPINDYIFIGLIIFLVSAKVIKMKGFKIILTIFLLIGTCNILNTSAVSFQSDNSLTWQNGFQINLNFNPIYFLILLFYIGIHYKEILKYLEKTSKEVDESKDKPLENYLSKYYVELKDKEESYLKNILSTRERWQKEYVMAAEQILSERNPS